MTTSPERPTSAVYDRERLGLYERWVWGFSFQPWFWGPRIGEIVDVYQANLSGSHLEVGVGTGLLLQRSGMPPNTERLHLLDANPGPLAEAQRRLAQYAPTTTRVDALADWPHELDSAFTSVGCLNVLHCLPDANRQGIAAKTAVLDSIARVLAPGGTFFGATLVRAPGQWRRPFAPVMMALYNQAGWFDNRADTPDGLAEELHARFDGVEAWRRGSLVLWQATARG